MGYGDLGTRWSYPPAVGRLDDVNVTLWPRNLTYHVTFPKTSGCRRGHWIRKSVSVSWKQQINNFATKVAADVTEGVKTVERNIKAVGNTGFQVNGGGLRVFFIGYQQ